LRHVEAASGLLKSLGVQEGILHDPAAAPCCAHSAHIFAPYKGILAWWLVLPSVVAACVLSICGADCGRQCGMIDAVVH
jgi:hypothetical protein